MHNCTWLLLLLTIAMGAAQPTRRKTQRHEFQQEFVEASKSHRTTAFIGGLQSGKSVAGADALRELLYAEGDHRLLLPEQARGLTPEIWILSKSYTLADQAWAYFCWRAPGKVYTPAECKAQGLTRGDVRTHWLVPGRDCMPVRVRVRTAHDPEQLRATGTLLAAWCDEVAHWPELAWLNLQGRGIVTPTKFLITTTPKGKNWLYRDVYVPWERKSDASIGVVTCRSMDNPWADRAYLEKLRLKFGAEYAAQELDALFTAAIGYVYADFDRLTHMVKPPSMDPEYYRDRVAGVDPGTSDPYAVGIWCRDWDGAWWLAEEFYRTGGSSSEFAPQFAKMHERWKTTAWWVDKRRPSDILDLRRAGLPAKPNLDVHAEGGRETIRPMIAVCRELLRAGKLHIAPSCEWHAEEFEGYAYKDTEDRDKNRTEQPVDYLNHAMDAMRYALCSVEELPRQTQRVRSGPDMLPRARPRDEKHPPGYKPSLVSAREHLLAVDKRMTERERSWRRRG